MWSAASFEAFARGAFDLDLPAVALGGLLLAAALFFGALLGGPPRLRVPDATLREATVPCKGDTTFCQTDTDQLFVVDAIVVGGVITQDSQPSC